MSNCLCSVLLFRLVRPSMHFPVAIVAVMVSMYIQHCSSEAVSCDERSRSMFSFTHHHSKDIHIDYVLLVIQSKSGFCKSHDCISEDTNGWGLHGLWPSQQGTMGPGFCNTTAMFNIDKLADLTNTLNADWPSLTDTNFSNFWKHEWCKHGTCAVAGGVGQITDEFSYFSQTLKLYQQYNIPDSLSQAGIKPSNDNGYNLDQFMKAFNSTPKVDCGKDSDRQILVEIRFCYSVHLQLIDCHESWFSSEDEHCDPDAPIYYLAGQ